MKTIDISEAKTHLSRLVERAVRGESFVVTAIEPHRLGFLKGEIEVPDDFDRMGASEIAALWERRRPAG